MECVELAESVSCETQEINTGTIIRKKRTPVITISGMSRCFVREAGAVPAAAVPRYCERLVERVRTELIVGLGPMPRNPGDSHYAAVPHSPTRKPLGPEAGAAGVEIHV